MHACRQISHNALVHIGGDANPHFSSWGEFPATLEFISEFCLPPMFAVEYFAAPFALKFRDKSGPIDDEGFADNPNALHRWRREFREGVERAFPGNGKSKAEQDRVAELERKIGQQTLEIDFLKRVLQRVEEARMLQALQATAPSTSKSTKKSSGARR